MNEIQLATLLALCSMILRKLLKFIKERNSDCGLETPCFKLHFDLENTGVELPHIKHNGDEEHEEHEEHKASEPYEHRFEEKSNDTLSLTTESSLSSEVYGDELDFEELTHRLEKIIAV